MKVFVYDDMLNPKYRAIIGVQPLEELIAEVEGKMYRIHQQPVLLRVDDVTVTRGLRRVFGAILTFDDADTERILNALDNYKGCSLSRIGKAHPHDLTYRATVKAYPIIAKSIQDFENFTYSYGRGIECLTYRGVQTHLAMINAIKIDKHQKYTQGYYPSGFINLLQRKGY